MYFVTENFNHSVVDVHSKDELAALFPTSASFASYIFLETAAILQKRTIPLHPFSEEITPLVLKPATVQSSKHAVHATHPHSPCALLKMALPQCRDHGVLYLPVILLNNAGKLQRVKAYVTRSLLTAFLSFTKPARYSVSVDGRRSSSVCNSRLSLLNEADELYIIPFEGAACNKRVPEMDFSSRKTAKAQKHETRSDDGGRWMGDGAGDTVRKRRCKESCRKHGMPSETTYKYRFRFVVVGFRYIRSRIHRRYI